MNEKPAGKRRIRMIAAVCAVLLIAGGSAGIYASRPKADAQAAQTAQSAEQPKNNASAAKTDQSVSAGGTVTCAQRTDTLGLVNTNVRLTVESVLAESGDTVTAGTALYQITADSLAKAEKTLRSELQSAESTLKKQKAQAQLDESKAGILYESELLLGDTAQQDYNAGLSELDSALQEAYDSYMEALDTVSNTPAEITNKQKALAEMQSEADALQTKQKNAQEKAGNAESAYRSAADSYNQTAEEYNAAAAVVRYLGKALGMDVSGITTAQTISADVQKQSAASAEPANPDKKADFSGGFGGGERPDGMMQSTRSFYAPASERPETLSEQAEETGGDALKTLYETACKDYEAAKKQLADADNTLKNAENEYRTLTDTLTEYSSALNEKQSDISALEQEISALESTLSKAQSNLSRLRSEYNSLKASYETDQLALEKERDTELASYENAQYHYELTCSTIAEELAKAQESYDTAAENLRIFEETLADGCIRAKQDGTIYSLNGQAGRSVSAGTAYVSYVDETSFAVTVELDQSDVTEVSIGDSVLIYSSETGIANGRITAISAGTSTSLADVRFNVTVTADDSAQLYSGESVNVYFNAGNMQQGDFSDFSGGKSGARTKSESDGSRSERPDFGGEMPSFGGGMPSGFDPSQMPSGFGGRKDG